MWRITSGSADTLRSRDGSVDGLEDLQEGMLAIVGARELGNGELRAQWVGVGRQRAVDGAPSAPAAPD